MGALCLGMLLALWPSAGPAPAKAVPQSEDPPGDSAEDAPEIDPLGPNAACYVCHTTFVWEELSKQHLREKVTCIKCHGLSAGHANDEDIGATPPDKTYRHDQIDASCRECHDEHNVPARKIIARWLQRKRPKQPLCTDCHGTHKIERPKESELPGDDPGTTPEQIIEGVRELERRKVRCWRGLRSMAPLVWPCWNRRKACSRRA